jgi:hypothetical protein
MTHSDLATITRQLGNMAKEADHVARQLESERKDQVLHRMAVSCRDFATAIRHALSALPAEL